MKKFFRLWILMLLAVSYGYAGMYQSVDPSKAVLLQSGKGKLYCPNCGMNLVKFYKTGHAVKHRDGKTHQYCSLHCLAEANGEIKPGMMVVDHDQLTFIDANNAYYVVGSAKPGTMSMNSKYAFSTQKAAETFAKANGGQVVNFASAFKTALSSMEKENAMIEKKRAVAAKKGQKIFEMMCDVEHDLPTFASIAEAKSHMVHSGLCGTLKDQQYHAMAIYLARKDAKGASSDNRLHVPEHSKCPVCGMFVDKFPKWAAKIELEGKTFYFDGVKDMMKFYFNPSAFSTSSLGTSNVVVTDYYTLKAIDGTKAWYVVGSNVYGPMGHELIPFGSKKDALSFKRDHGGTSILSFEQVSPDTISSLEH